MMRILPALLAAMVILGALPAPAQTGQSPFRIAIVHDGGRSHDSGELRRAAESLGGAAVVTEYAPGADNPRITGDTDFRPYDLVVIDAAADDQPLKAADFARIREAARLLVLNQDGEAHGNVDTAAHPDVARYWSNRSVENDRGLIAYLTARIGGRDIGASVPTPVIYPTHGFYHSAADRLYADREEFLTWYASRTEGHAYDPARPTLALSSDRSYYQKQNMAKVDALVTAAETRGANMLVLLRTGAAEFSPLLRDGKAVADALLFDGERLDYKDQEAGIAQARQLDIPVLMAIDYYKGSPEDYRSSPNGLAPDLTPRLVTGEREGMFEPIAVSARDDGTTPASTVSMPEQVDWRIDRALAWARLARLDNADKRIAFTFWSEAGGKADVGGDPDDFLDVPGSLAVFLREMRQGGYAVGADTLPDAEALSSRMARAASNVGSWAPAELAKRVQSRDVALLPETRYLDWYKALPAERRAEIEAVWGPPPGEVMVHQTTDGERMIAIPRIEIGNVLIAPHPMWGYLENEDVLLSKDAMPPHHQYLAFFLWLQHEWQADAWVSPFTNITLQPGKAQGPLADDHIGLLLGDLPHIHPERLGANGGLSNKRKALSRAPGWYNIVVPYAVQENLGELRGMVGRLKNTADTEQRTAMRPALEAEIRAQGLDRALPLDVSSAALPDLVAALDDYFADLESASMPWGGKILGQAPEGDTLVAMVRGMLGADLTDAVADKATAEALLRAVLLEGISPRDAIKAQLGQGDATLETLLTDASGYADGLKGAPREVAAVMEALDGQWLEPGPSGDAFRRPEVLPPGRVLYSFDQRAIPTVEAEAIGIRQAEELIARHRAEHDGQYPDKLAFVLWSGEVAKNNGVTEAQILHLLGTRVTRNWRGEVTGVALIPHDELGRPRVDVLVTTSGVYRDHFQDKVALISEATRLAAASPEADNPVADATEETEKALVSSGESVDVARQLSLARVFSPAPGAYSPSIQFLARSGDQRGGEAKMADLYARRMSHAYGGGLYGAYSRDAFDGNVRRMDGAVLPRSSDVNGLLDHPMSAAFLGGLNMAAKSLTGEDTPLYVSNLRDLDNPMTEGAAQVLQTELRTRYFNPDWIRENQSHGYDGARNFMFMTENLDLWDSTATQTVSSADWAEVKAVYVDDKFDLGMEAFFDEHNPFAHQMLMINLLGAAQRGHWEATAEELAQVAERLAQSVQAHGPACEAGQCRNEAMTAFVDKALSTMPDAAPLAEAYKAAIEQATQPAGAAPAMASGDTVTGQVVEEVAREQPESNFSLPLIWLWLAAGGMILFTVGWVRGR